MKEEFYLLKSLDIFTFVMWSTERWNWLHRRKVRLVTNYHKLEIIRSPAFVRHSISLYLCCGTIHSPCPMLTQWGTKTTGLCNETYCNRLQTLCWLLLLPLYHFVTLGLLSAFGDSGVPGIKLLSIDINTFK